MTRDARGNGRREDGGRASLETLREALADAQEALARAERASLEAERAGEEKGAAPEPERADPGWRERLWTAPSEARVGVAELREALGVSESWIYQRTRSDADPRLPHGKLAGSLVFRVGEVRAWIRDHEEVVEAYRSEPAPGELRVESGGAT